MSWERVIRWTCDRCGLEVDRFGYGLPKHWKYVHTGPTSPAEHRCEVCSETEVIVAQVCRSTTGSVCCRKTSV